MKSLDLPALLVVVMLPACDDKPQVLPERQLGDKSGAVGSADPTRTGQRLPPGTEFRRAKGEIEAKAGTSIGGEVKLEEVTEGVRVALMLHDAPRSQKLSVVVHEAGDCKDFTKGFGAHWNPRNVRHGLPGAPEQHAGDLGNVTIDENGKGTLLVLTSGGNLRKGDPLSYLHRPLVVHAREDRGDPSGDTGEGIACARIEGT